MVTWTTSGKTLTASQPTSTPQLPTESPSSCRGPQRWAVIGGVVAMLAAFAGR
jgi:hypothetical protein